MHGGVHTAELAAGCERRCVAGGEVRQGEASVRDRCERRCSSVGVRRCSLPENEALPCAFFRAHGKKTLGKKLFVVRFYVGTRQTNSCAFFCGARQTFFPSAIKPVSLFVVFAMWCCKTYDKRISLSCAKEKRTTNIYLCVRFTTTRGKVFF
jgi:hypothetical protein